MDSGSSVPRLQSLPSAHEFSSQIEANNMPLVFEGYVKNWPAYSKWDPKNGGLDYLKAIAGDASVQVMQSTSGSHFYGNIRSHERVAIRFGEFLDYALRAAGMKENISSEGKHDPAGYGAEDYRLYLAQVPIFNPEHQEPCALKELLPDIFIHGFLEYTSITNINMWMTAHESKSSTHYDPFHNILCVVGGSKKVVLWPPSATSFLYPHPVFGEASNHSAVDFVNPDYKKYPRYVNVFNCCQVAFLEAGDALFIPEGWYHQVNSTTLTMAVNLWWPSKISLALHSHMDGYYLRRIVSSLLDREKEQIIESTAKTRSGGKSEGWTDQERILFDPNNCCEKLISSTKPIESEKQNIDSNSQGSNAVKDSSIEILGPLQKLSLYYLCVFASDGVENEQISYNKDAELNKEDSSMEKIVIAALSSIGLSEMKEMFLVMVKCFPRTLEILVLYRLTPIMAEFLTKKFDEMDKIFSEADQEQFYKVFYSVFEDPRLAMSALLDRKEEFSAMALSSVLEGFLGCKLQVAMQHV